MIRKIQILLLVTLGLSLIGCASATKMQTLETSIEVLNTENMTLKGKLSDVEGRLDKLSATHKSDVESIRAESLKVKVMVADLDQKVATSQAQATPAPSHETKKPVADEKKAISSESAAPESKSAKIKVLSGTGDRKSAKEAAAKLRDAGYNVTHVDMAQKGVFKVNTVYFNKGFDATAEEIAKTMDGIAKPLAWQSTFDIIVITGKSSIESPEKPEKMEKSKKTKKSKKTTEQTDQ